MNDIKYENYLYSLIGQNIRADKIMRVQIRWKLITICAAIIFFIILLYVFRRSEECDFRQGTEETRALTEYCNFAHMPAKGLEGDVPVDGPDAKYRLRTVYAVIRHGDRSALHSVPGLSSRDPFLCRFNPLVINSVEGFSDYVVTVRAGSARRLNQTYAGYQTHPERDECDLGDLTPDGAAQQFRNGRFLQQAYITKHALLDETKLEQQVLVRATTISRTFQSSVAFLHGFLNSRNVDLPKLKYEMADNNSMCVQNCECSGIRSHLDSFASSFTRALVNREIHQEIFNSDAMRTRMTHLFDTLVTRWCHSITMHVHENPSCVNGSTVARVHAEINSLGHKSITRGNYKRVAKLKMAPLLQEISERAMKIDNTNEPRFVLYSGHDSTVEPLLAALGASDGRWPRYAARVIFEIYESQQGVSGEGEKFIRILQDGIVITGNTEFCLGNLIEPMRLGLCPLRLFIGYAKNGLLKSIGEKSLTEACSKSIEIN